MPILYSVIARGTVVLTKYASCAGNFSEVTEQIMAKISSENAKLTYSHGSYLFHYICENRIIYMCITDDVSINNVAAVLYQRWEITFGVRNIYVHRSIVGKGVGEAKWFCCPRGQSPRGSKLNTLNENKNLFSALNSFYNVEKNDRKCNKPL